MRGRRASGSRGDGGRASSSGGGGSEYLRGKVCAFVPAAQVAAEAGAGEKRGLCVYVGGDGRACARRGRYLAPPCPDGTRTRTRGAGAGALGQHVVEGVVVVVRVHDAREEPLPVVLYLVLHRLHKSLARIGL